MKRKAYLKLPDRYTGWLGEDCYKAEGRRYIKRLEHKAIRRYVKKEMEHEANEARA